jgi:hypothetical protein
MLCSKTPSRWKLVQDRAPTRFEWDKNLAQSSARSNLIGRSMGCFGVPTPALAAPAHKATGPVATIEHPCRWVDECTSTMSAGSPAEV